MALNMDQGYYCHLELALGALKKDWLRRQIRAEVSVALTDGADPVGVGQALIKGVSSLLQEQDKGKLQITTLRESMERLQEGEPLLSPEQAANKLTARIQTIDDVVRMGAGRLGIVAAMPSAGKTSFALQMAQQSAVRGKRVLVISLEMDRAEIESRRLANWTGRNSWKIMGNHKRMTFDQRHLDAADNCLTISCGAGQDWWTLEAKIRATHANTPLDAIIIDYFTLLEPPEKRKNENTANSYGHISKAAKMLAKDLQACVVLVSQFNRTSDEYVEPVLKQLKETSQLEQDADWALLLWNVRNPADNPDDRIIACRIAKNRGGKRGDILHMVFSPASNRFVQCMTESRLSA